MIDSRRKRALLIPGGGWRKKRPQPRCKENSDSVDAECEYENVLTDNADCLSRQFHEQWQRAQRITHQDKVTCLGGDISPCATDRQTNRCLGESRCVVDSIADHRYGLIEFPFLDVLCFLDWQ